MSLVVDIHKRLGDFRLDVAFEAENGVTCLLGPSGCRKSDKSAISFKITPSSPI